MIPSNPFKFGSIVRGAHFTNRKDEIRRIKALLESENHLVLIGPRRFGKTSLIYNVTSGMKRPVLHLNAQMFTSTDDMARQLVSRVFSLYPFEKVKNFLKNFRIVPNVVIHPVSGDIEISLTSGRSGSDSLSGVEDALNLLEKVSSGRKKLVVVLDEFQDILRLDKNLDKVMRSVMQQHKHINYLLSGSQESLMQHMFTDKKSAFYHFGMIMYLEKISREEFAEFLSGRFRKITKKSAEIAEDILNVTDSHPYYTQQLAWVVWEELTGSESQPGNSDVVHRAVNTLVSLHDIDYDRIWGSFNNTDRKVLIGLALGNTSLLSRDFLINYEISATSTVHSSLKRLLESGMLLKLPDGYQIDDPFFARWIVMKRNAWGES